ncbi:unnamed protein product [marine sediment metagenome]|uniref:Uncharacterized protein n=1 Tax=marine sediment metagenome TaxID=412755 RepID=X1LQM0_9ZZZZ
MSEDMKKCHYCKKKPYAEHHISYDPEETVDVCKSCHYKVHKTLKNMNEWHGYLCIWCGRSVSCTPDYVCWYCKNPNEVDWFGLTSKDKRKPIFRFNYHWLETKWI